MFSLVGAVIIAMSRNCNIVLNMGGNDKVMHDAMRQATTFAIAAFAFLCGAAAANSLADRIFLRAFFRHVKASPEEAIDRVQARAS
jgi:hypothetical protein